MQISKDMVVSIEYKLTDDQGNLMDSSEGGDPLAYLHGAGNIITGLEDALIGKTIGEELQVRIPPEDAYGIRDDDKQQSVPRNLFGDEEIKIGTQYYAEGPEGNRIAVTVIALNDDTVTVDANHPLAGYHLNFEVKVVDIRDATQEELEHGHAHGPHGHQHA